MRRLKIIRKSSTDEWVVRVQDRDRKRIEAECYYCTDKDDAKDTLGAMAGGYRKKGFNVKFG